MALCVFPHSSLGLYLMSLASNCTVLEGCFRWYYVNLVKWGTIFPRIPYLVWFQFRVDQKNNVHEIWDIRATQQPFLSEVHHSQTCCQTDGEMGTLWVLGGSGLPLHSACPPDCGLWWPTAALGCAPTEAVVNIRPKFPRTSPKVSLLCPHFSCWTWLFLRISSMPLLVYLCQHFGQTCLMSLFFLLCNSSCQTFTSLVPSTLVSHSYNKA